MEVQTAFDAAGTKISTRFSYAWQAQGFLRVAKTSAGMVGLKRARKNARHMAGAGITSSVGMMLDAEYLVGQPTSQSV